MTPTFAWSFSALNSYEICPSRYYHYSIVKDVVEGESIPLREGNALHKAFEERVRDGTELPLGMTHHEKLMEAIIKAPGKTYAEQSLALTKSFEPVGYFGKNVWFRTKIDVAKVNDETASIFDYKTGKPSEDDTQLKLMSATIFHHMPRIERVKAAYLFVNHGTTRRAEYGRDELPGIWAEMLPRVRALEQARLDDDFPPKPNGLCRKWCGVKDCPYWGIGG